MLRKIASTSLFVSFIAVASSGILMMIMDSFEFNLRMHPVHKLFGLLMIIAGIVHVVYNFKAIKKYLSLRHILTLFLSLSLIMILLYVIGMKRPIDQSVIGQVEAILEPLKAGQ